MRKSQTQKIGKVIDDYLGETNLNRKLKEFRLVSGWESIMGKTVSSRTKQIQIRDKVLYISVTSSVLKNELNMMRNDIVCKMNELAGERLIERIVVR